MAAQASALRSRKKFPLEVRRNPRPLGSRYIRTIRQAKSVVQPSHVPTDKYFFSQSVALIISHKVDGGADPGRCRHNSFQKVARVDHARSKPPTPHIRHALSRCRCYFVTISVEDAHGQCLANAPESPRAEIGWQRECSTPRPRLRKGVGRHARCRARTDL